MLFFVEAGPRLTRFEKSGLVLPVCTLRLESPTLLVRSLDLKEDRLTLAVYLVDPLVAAVPTVCCPAPPPPPWTEV